METDDEILTRKMHSLPDWAMVSVAARSARRVAAAYRARRPELVWKAIEEAEALAEAPPPTQIPIDAPMDPVSSELCNWFYPGVNDSIAMAAANARGAAGLAERGMRPWVTSSAVLFADNAARILGVPSIRRAIRDDVELIGRLSRVHGWDRHAAVSPSLYHTHIDFSERAFESLIVEPKSSFDELVLRILRSPSEFFRLSPRNFEELIARVIEGLGFAVELTARTNDGGKDIIAVADHVSREKLLIECKRYKPTLPVRVGAVRALHGVTASEGATKGILVTTSYLTQPAKSYVEKHKWILDAKDAQGILGWLRAYDRIQMEKALRGVSL